MIGGGPKFTYTRVLASAIGARSNPLSKPSAAILDSVLICIASTPLLLRSRCPRMPEHAPALPLGATVSAVAPMLQVIATGAGCTRWRSAARLWSGSVNRIRSTLQPASSLWNDAAATYSEKSMLALRGADPADLAAH